MAETLKGADIVVDLANSPSFEDKASMDFFETSGRNLLAAEINAGVKHHIALSVVGTDRLQKMGYFRAKQVQENIIKKSGVPYTIVHSTQFFEFLGSIAASGQDGENIRLSPAKIQPIASDDVAALVAEVVLGSPLNGIVEIAGPECFSMSDLVQQYLIKMKDGRSVVTDPAALYFSAHVEDLTLVPGNNAKLGTIGFDSWFNNQVKK